MREWWRKPIFWLILLMTIAVLLRFYRIADYLQFLGDEGRDVLVVKRMIVDHKFTLLGPTASVGGFYTGPIYYYFMAPFLWLWRLDPVGPAVMSAFFGLLTIVLLYYFTKLLVDERAAIVAALLATVSAKMVAISRFSWNPNPVPFFSILACLGLYLAAVWRRGRFTFISGVAVGVLYQLHYTDLIFIPMVILLSLALFPRREWLKQWGLLFLGFVLGCGPFLLFEVRHGFPNTQSVWEFVTRGGHTIAPRDWNPVWLFNDMGRILYETVFGFRGPILNAIYLATLVALAFWVKQSWQTGGRVILLVWLVLGVYGIGLYRGQILEHYYGYLYPVPFILVGLLVSRLSQARAGLALGVVLVGTLVVFAVQRSYFWRPPNNLVGQTKSVDEIVLELAGGEEFNFALIAPGNSDHAYRYFLEIWGRKPVTIYNEDIDPKRGSVTDQLIVVCEQKDCQPLGHPLWEIAGFGRAEIESARFGPVGVVVYKLVHYNNGR